ncbi:Sensor_kinase_SpoOB-type, alpha-helical domain [Seinonella peptonophila]|uniref:Sensor_kinase_SpoOB-type, alpha-helical domain n=1 Tax=Seinonella peptonophila TaxID=112248 RepID=A0A1M4TT60_9BACL|nr:Spo0B domain-containing protein [Seinonella peptonophila]SHE47608.1 Sensor_kinase_SpoOB-type, alpha-helical domain [Seinonella peptonophila]
MDAETRKWLLAFSPSILLLIYVLLQVGERKDIFYCVLASLALLIISIVYMTRRVREQNRVREAKKIKHVLTRMRHDWMNHVQVLMGFLMLEKPAEMKRYLQKLIHRAMRDRRIADITYAPLSTLVLLLEHRYSMWRFYISLRDPFQVSAKDQKDLYFVLQIFFTWLQEQAKNQPEWTDLYLEFSSSEHGIDTVIKRITEEGKLAAFTFMPEAWKELEHSLEPWGVTCKQVRTSKMYIELLKQKRG